MSIQVHHSIAIDPVTIELPGDNPNHMTPEDMEALRGFVESRGFLQPVLVTPAEGDHPYRVIDGHHRVTVALRLKMPEISAIVVDASEAERIRDRIAMNRIRGELDLTAVARDLEMLIKEYDSPHEIALTGYSDDDVSAMLEAVRKPSDLEVLQNEGAADPPSHEDDEGPQVFSLVLRFTSEVDRARVKEAAMDCSLDGTIASGVLELAKDNHDT